MRLERAPLARVARMAVKPRKEGGELGDFGELTEIHRPVLERIAQRLSGNPEVAKDLVQETLVRALGRPDRLQQLSNPVAWLVKILTRLYFDYLKHQKVITRAEPELAASAQHVDDDSLLDNVTDDQLRAAVQALEPELRKLVELCYLKQMRYREVAAVLDLPIGTIGSRLMRARERLRDLLEAASSGVVKP